MVDVTEMTNWSIDLIGVTKTYDKEVHALRGVNVQVGRGEIFGLLGPNGAGKTTLVKIITTVVRPTKAMGTVLGRPLGNTRKRGLIGYLPENHRFPRYLTGAQVLDYYGALARVPRDLRRKRAAELLDRVGISEWADVRVSKYSKGMLQRLGLAQALINDPDLIILDEPTDGLDPMGRRDVRELLLEHKQRGKTVFINSHLLSELEMVCDRVSILVEGWVKRQGTLKELTEHAREYRIAVSGDAAPLKDRIGEAGARLDGKEVIIPGHELEQVNSVIDLLRANQILIDSVQPRRFTLEDIFVEAIGGARVGKARPARRAD